jgi:hypothetical protein
MSKSHNVTTMVSAGYPFWYSYGVSHGLIKADAGASRVDSVSGLFGLFEKPKKKTTTEPKKKPKDWDDPSRLLPGETFGESSRNLPQ